MGLTFNGNPVSKVTINSGQDVNYLIKDGKLVWADPRIYLDNSTDDGAYIDTNIRGSFFQGKTVIAHVAYYDRYSDRCAFGLIDTTNGSRVENGVGWILTSFSANYGNVGVGSANYIVINEKVEIIYTPTIGTINGVSVNNWYVYAGSANKWGVFSPNTTRTCYLLASNRQAGFRKFGGKFYDFIILDGDTVLYNFVPVPAGLKIGNFTVPSNGMFDIVAQTFYGNAGTGTFTIGKSS